jgi:uncharacterized membrane protein YphA (DoxX/SURF4 family)
MTSTASRGAVAPRFAGREPQLWATTVLRVVLGLVMVAAGVLKISNPDEAVRAVQAYQILPSSIDQFVGYALPLLEIVLGILLLIGLGTRVAAVLAGVFMVVFIVAVSSAWIRGLSIDCGCFGGGGTVSPVGKAWRYTSEILRDLLLAGMASFIAVFPASRFAVDGSGRVGTGDLGLLDELDDDEPDDEIDDETDELDDAPDPEREENQP